MALGSALTEGGERFSELQETLDELQQGVDSTRKELAGTEGQLEEAAEALVEKASEVLGAVETRTAELQAARDEVLGLIEQLAGTVNEVSEDIHQGIEQLDAELGKMDSEIDAIEQEVETAVENCEQKLRNLDSEATNVREALKSTADDAKQRLEEAASDHIAQRQQELEGEVEQLEQFFSTKFTPQIESHVESLGGRLDALSNNARSMVETRSAELETSATDILEEFTNGQLDELESLLGRAQSVEQTLENVKGIVESGSQAFSGAKDGLHEGMSTSSSGLKLAVDTLHRVKEVLDELI